MAGQSCAGHAGSLSPRTNSREGPRGACSGKPRLVGDADVRVAIGNDPVTMIEVSGGEYFAAFSRRLQNTRSMSTASNSISGRSAAGRSDATPGEGMAR
jgi:hypothetical protein